jgi:uncharacterized protein (DUF58 family)
VVDLSASGTFGSLRRTKEALAIEVCAVLALAAARNNDRVGATLFTDRIELHIGPAKGRRHSLRVISDLLSCVPVGTGTDLTAALTDLEATLRRRAIIFVLSDFLGAEDDGVLARLARRHDVVAIQLVDPRERTLPDAGVVTLWEPESGAWLLVDTGDPMVRDRFAANAREFDGGLERRFREQGVDLLRLETGKPYAEPLLTFFRRRERQLWR